MSFTAMGVSSAHPTGHSGTPSTLHTSTHNICYTSSSKSVSTPPLPRLNTIPTPQNVCIPHTRSDQWRYFDAEEVELGEYGISLRDALAINDSGLEGRDDVSCGECGPFIYIRLNWPGSRNRPRQVLMRDFRGPQSPITCSVLAENVERSIEADYLYDPPIVTRSFILLSKEK